MAGQGLHYPGPRPTAHEQGAQGRPGDGHHIQPRVQIISHVHKNKAGLKSSQDVSPRVRPSSAELETSVLPTSLGQALLGWRLAAPG